MSETNIRYKKVDDYDSTISNFFDKHFMEYSLNKININSNYHQFIHASYNNEELIGAIRCSIMYKVMNIELLIIDPKYRKLGIGKSLYNMVVDYAKELNCTMITVETFNFQAVEYWKNKGFKIDFVRNGYNGNSLYYFSKDI